MADTLLGMLFTHTYQAHVWGPCIVSITKMVGRAISDHAELFFFRSFRGKANKITTANPAIDYIIGQPGKRETQELGINEKVSEINEPNTKNLYTKYFSSHSLSGKSGFALCKGVILFCYVYIKNSWFYLVSMLSV